MSNAHCRLLDRQVRKYVPPELVPHLKDFLEAVDLSYGHYEQDRKLITHAMDLSSNEVMSANRTLRSNIEFLESFNYGAAHDLKNHAINMRGMITIVGKSYSSDPERARKALEFLEKASAQFVRTVEDLLMVSRIQTDGPSLQRCIPVQQLKDMVMAECSFLIAGNGAQLTWHIDVLDETAWPEEPYKTILVNLLSNAIKYKQPVRTPEIDISLARTDRSYSIRVADNGRGMDLTKEGHLLFRMFSRLSSGREQEGTGVGLFVMKKLVERLLGTIDLESEPNRGTTFLITIPHEDR
jgi:light-regulated signal transduction histidine kinase (bacteriophytochrome)